VLSEADIRRAIEGFVREHGRLPSVGSLRRRFGWRLGESRARQAIQAYRENAPSGEETPMLDAEIPAPRAPRRDEWPQIAAPCLVISDLQIPAHDPAWLQHCVERAIGMGIRRLLIAGDLVDFTHLSRWPAEHHYSAEDELEDAHAVLRWLRVYMSEIHLIPGNHDDRLAKRLDRQLSTRAVLELGVKRNLDGVYVHWHHHARVGRTWLVVHPGNYSKTPPAVARELAATHHRNVAMGHDHLFALGFDTSGNYFCISYGMMADPARLAYAHRELRRAPQMQQGALIIDAEERPILLHPRLP